MENKHEFDEKGRAAEKIVNDYGASLAIESNGFARPISLLKNSKEEIKDAIKYYILVLLSSDKLSKEITSVLSFGYASVELFTDDKQAAFINNLEEKNKEGTVNKEEHKIYEDFVKSTTLAMQQNIADITAFLKKEIKKK